MGLFIFSFLKAEGMFVTEDAQSVLTKTGVTGLEKKICFGEFHFCIDLH
jgi:hypothetical protein